jgi:hypothetical protein
MALSHGDDLPRSITLAEAYMKIRGWYREHADSITVQDEDYRQRSQALIRALPTARTLTELEIRAVLEEVISGLLEWAYHQSDGDFKMAAYATKALESAGLPKWLSKDEIEQLRMSRLWPFLGRSRD